MRKSSKKLGIWNREIGFGAVAVLVGIVSPRLIHPGIDPKKWDYGYFTEATALERLNRGDEAEVLYKEALAINPRAPFVNFNLGERARAARNYQAAADYYRRETENQPAYGRAWNNLGLMLLPEGREDEALACFEYAYRLRPDLKEAAVNAAAIWRNRGHRAQSAGNSEEAARCFEMATRFKT